MPRSYKWLVSLMSYYILYGKLLALYCNAEILNIYHKYCLMNLNKPFYWRCVSLKNCDCNKS